MAQNIGWSGNRQLHGSSTIAALMIWIVLVTQADETDENAIVRCVDMPYESLMRATGLSRKLVADGGLRGLNLVDVEVVRRFSRYHLRGCSHGDWAKLAARALYKGDKVHAFYSFHKRSISELHALMMFVYYMAVRSRLNAHSTASFEKIYDRTRVPEKPIPAGNAFLINCALLVNIDKSSTGVVKFREPNKYYLVGSRDLFVGMQRDN